MLLDLPRRSSGAEPGAAIAAVAAPPTSFVAVPVDSRERFWLVLEGIALCADELSAHSLPLAHLACLLPSSLDLLLSLLLPLFPLRAAGPKPETKSQKKTPAPRNGKASIKLNSLSSGEETEASEASTPPRSKLIRDHGIMETAPSETRPVYFCHVCM